MSRPAPVYDLVLLLDPEAPEAARAKIVTDARAAIEARGELLRHDEWGERALAYPIGRKASAEFHLLQFHAADGGLLDALNRSLRITDAVTRFRLIKLKPGVPEAPDMRAPAPGRRGAEPGAAGSEPDGEAAPGAQAPPSAESAAAAAA